MSKQAESLLAKLGQHPTILSGHTLDEKRWIEFSLTAYRENYYPDFDSFKNVFFSNGADNAYPENETTLKSLNDILGDFQKQYYIYGVLKDSGMLTV